MLILFLVFSHVAINVCDVQAAWYRALLLSVILFLLPYSWKFITIFSKA
jgi:hypothetical protein